MPYSKNLYYGAQSQKLLSKQDGLDMEQKPFKNI